jgi:hypothetical protein
MQNTLECIKCGTPQSGFLCKCGTRYCGVACQKGHWQEHKGECKAIRKKAEFKREMDTALRLVVQGWDKSKHICFGHCTKADALAAGYNEEVARGELPNIKITSAGVMAFYGHDEVNPMLETRLRHSNHIKCRRWLLELPDMPPKTITSVMIDRTGRPADEILKMYAPSLAEPGRTVLHFFNYREAISVMGPLMEVT